MGSRPQAQQLWHTGLIAPWHMESSQTRNQICVPCIGRQILNHWTTRDVPNIYIFNVGSVPQRRKYLGPKKVIMWPSHDLEASHWLGHLRPKALTLISSLRSVILSPSLLSLSPIMSSLVSDFLLYTSFVCFVKWRVVFPLLSKCF